MLASVLGTRAILNFYKLMIGLKYLISQKKSEVADDLLPAVRYFILLGSEQYLVDLLPSEWVFVRQLELLKLLLRGLNLRRKEVFLQQELVVGESANEVDRAVSEDDEEDCGDV